MGFGRVAVIMYIFSFGILFFGYYLNQIFANPLMSANSSMTYSAINTLVSSFTINQGINTSLIFGDFIAGLTVLFGLLAGNILDSAFHSLPMMDSGMLLLETGLFDMSSIFLWVFIVANRDIN